MNVIPYSHQWIDDSDIKAVVKVLKSYWITQGPKIKEFEDAICKYTGAKYTVVVSSGTAALHIACLSAGIREGDEVITSPITFVASSNCVLYCGGKPVFADVDKDTANINPKEIRKSITKKAKVIIPVHFAGHPCDLKEIRNIAKEHNLLVIEDSAHALGAEYRGSKIGSCKYSDMAVLSFHPVKSITTGEGGAVLTNNKNLYKRLIMLRSHGITKDKKNLINKNEGRWYYEMQFLGFNYRMTDFQCALGTSQIRKIDEFIKRRREIVEIYNKELSRIEEIILPVEKPYVRSSWHIYCIRLRDPKKRKYVFEELQRKRVSAQVHYIPVHLQPYYRKHFGYKEGDFSKAEDYYERTITLPLYPKMKTPQINKVIKTLKEILR